MRILIIDEHEVYRVACAALLRTEGLDVTHVSPDDEIVGLARSLRPDVLLLDAGPSAIETARQLRSLPCRPTMLLTSSGARELIHPCLAELPFLAKADICRDAIARAVAEPTDEPPEPGE